MRDKEIRMDRIGFWSTDYSKSTGQALVTRRVAENVLPNLKRRQRYIFPATGRPQAIYIWTLAWIRLWRDIALGRLDTLYLVCSRSNMGFFRDFPALVAARVGIRVVVHVHGSDIVSLLTLRRISSLARWCYAHCDVVVPSAHLTKPLEKIVKSVSVCEGFFADRDSVSLNSPRDRDGLQVFWNSNVMASKGYFDLATAIEQANKYSTSITLVSIGTLLEDEEMSLSELSSEFSKISDLKWFEYHGKVEHSVAVEMLASADVVALPSRYSSECQPIAIIEAMCSGKAVIVSDMPAIRATVGYYPAEFVEIQSIEAIILALSRLFSEKEADPVEFVKRRTGPALESRRRFAIDRFDSEIGAIILGTVGQ